MKRWALIVVGLYLAVVVGFRVAGRWHSSVSDAEIANRLRELDSPVYTHVGGLAAAERPRSEQTSAGSHVRP